MLLKLFNEDKITWSGKFRAPLNDQILYPKPLQKEFPIWRAVGGHKGSAFLAGQQGVPMSLAALGGSASYFNETVETYKKSLAVHHPNLEPQIAIDNFMYIADTDEEAFKEYYQYADQTMRKVNGNGFSKQGYSTALDIRNVMLIGSPETIINKIVYQYNMFKHDRHFFQIDIGGMPYDKVAKMIKTLGEVILPAVKERLGMN